MTQARTVTLPKDSETAPLLELVETRARLGNREVLRGITFAVKSGEILGLVRAERQWQDDGAALLLQRFDADRWRSSDRSSRLDDALA